MMIAEITSRAKRNRRRKRIGRGPGSGHGKTSTRGHKGEKARTGTRGHVLREGGQMLFFRRIPKRGFSNFRFRRTFQVVNVGALQERFEDGARINPAVLAEAGLIRNAADPVKILGTGEISKKLDVEATCFSTSAAMKITRAGGQIKSLG
ncbi:MAG: 50S ribosomal protein L15 [Phycisphaerae bacterium]